MKRSGTTDAKRLLLGDYLTRLQTTVHPALLTLKLDESERGEARGTCFRVWARETWNVKRET